MTDGPTAMTADELAALLREAGRHHHQAFIETDGGDPEWPLWYAGWLQAHLWDRVGGSVPTRSRLVHLLVQAERDHAAADDGSTWPEFYAAAFLAALGDR